MHSLLKLLPCHGLGTQIKPMHSCSVASLPVGVVVARLKDNRQPPTACLTWVFLV
jgi:hypothetical protein